jgi:lipopolysaccharide transport system permease protein
MEQSASNTTSTPLLTIRPSSGWSAVNVRELIQYRDLLFVFALRDIKLRYRQTLLGPIWILLQPLMGAGVLSFIFGGIAHLKAPGTLPYFVYCFTGQLGFSIFSGIVTKVSTSLTANAHLVAKVYFPRLLLPFSTVFAVMVDFCAAATILPVLMVTYHVVPGIGILLLPFWIALFVLLALGVGLLAAALMVSYRDVSALITVIMGFLPYVSAVGFDPSTLSHRMKMLVLINPVAQILEGFRWSLLNTQMPSANHILFATAISAGSFVLGTLLFRKMEKKFADVI